MKYFSIRELTASTTARRKGIDNTPNAAVIDNLTKLVDNVLDPLRTWFGKPINVTSGYRCVALNKAVGGAKTSQHCLGQAADIDTGSRLENKKLFDYIKANLPFDQLIDEKNLDWVHVSYKSSVANRKQVLYL